MIISQTPLRISFVGGGTDLRSFYQLEDGMVLSSAIDKYVYVIVKERFDDKIYINYSIKEIVSDVSEIQHQLVREAMKKV
ncbi:MAG: GHMP kinase, partial [Nitrospiraceae bacterium]